MANPEVARLIGANLHTLPHPKHGQIRLMGFRPHGLSQQPKDVQAKVNSHAEHIGESIVNLIELNGKTVVDTAELDRLRAAVAVIEPGQKIAHAYCAHCATELIRLLVDDHLNAKLHRTTQEAIGLKHKCWA
jgi:hypothetical protein